MTATGEYSMTSSATNDAARILAAARRSGRRCARLPEACRPSDIASALAIQRRVTELLETPVDGWKCSVPTPDKTLVAPIYAPTIHRTSPCAVTAGGGTVEIEPEIAFVVGRDLPPRAAPYADAEVRAAIAETRLVLELLGCRYADPAAVGFPEMLADGANNQGLFVGPVVDRGPERTLDAFTVTIAGPSGTLLTREGRHPDGHPLRPFAWLANFLVEYGEPLRAGQIVTTGSYAGALTVPLATPLTVTYGDLGTLTVTLIAAA
jgi:2-keto-4-pentenoate hydratase